MTLQTTPIPTDREPREIFMRAVRACFTNEGVTWDKAWSTCANVTHSSVYQEWLAKAEKTAHGRARKAVEIANALPSSVELDAQNDRLRRVVELVNDVMTQHPRMPYDTAFARVRRDNPALFSPMQQPARHGA